MIVASSAVCRSIFLAAAFCLAVWSITGVFRHARGAEDIGPSLPPAVENLLRWLPVDTETMVVAQSFKIRRSRDDKNIDFAAPIWDRLQDLSLCGLSELEGGAGLDELLDREVSVAINGARNFTIVSAFGSLRYEGCGIVRFKEPLPDAGRRLMDALRKKAKAVRTIAGTEVFDFPDRTVMESTFKPKKWQGQYIACLSADTLLCASSDAFLREVLDRSAERPASRALAADLPEWKHVDCKAPVWMIRHIPRKFSGQLAAGVTWSLKPQGRNVFEIAYIPVEGKKPLPVAEIWKDRDLDAQPAIAAKDDGTVVVTIDLEKGKQQIWYGFTVYWSLGEAGQPQSNMSHADLLKLADGDDPEEDVENPPNAETANLPADCLEEIWSKGGVVYSGLAVGHDGKTIVALRDQFADVFDVSGKLRQSIKLPVRRRLVRWARLTAAKPSELIVFERWGEGGPVALRSDGTKLWEQSRGEGIDDVWAADLDGDGKDEIIVGYNGSTGLHVFNSDGSLRWKDTSIGNVWRVTAADIDGGELEVLAASGKVYVFKADGGKIATLDAGIQATMVRAFRPPGESTDHLLAVGSNSREARMVALNGKGERLWQTELPGGVNTCASLAVAPGSKWAAAGSMGGVVWVTDVATGKILGARPKLGFPCVAWVNGAGEAPLLLVASTHGLAAFRVSESGSTGRKK